jgi:hypothetical protein
MKNVIGLVAIAGLASAAVAQPIPVETQLRYEVRIFNGGNNTGWGSSVDAQPGDRVEVRAVVSYTGTTQVFGIGQITFQPVVSSWTAADALVTDGPNNQIGPMGSNITTPRGYVSDTPGVYGRIEPFAASAYNTSTFLRGHVHNISGGTFLRIARADVTNWIGVGASSGAGAANNTNGGGGVNINQGGIGSNRPTTPTDYPAQNNNTQNVVVFKFGFTLSGSTDVRDMTVSTPALGIGRSTASATFGQPDTRWHNAANSAQPGAYRTDVAVVDAHINVVPTPASLALMGLGGLLVARRRR